MAIDLRRHTTLADATAAFRTLEKVGLGCAHGCESSLLQHHRRANQENLETRSIPRTTWIFLRRILRILPPPRRPSPLLPLKTKADLEPHTRWCKGNDVRRATTENGGTATHRRPQSTRVVRRTTPPDSCDLVVNRDRMPASMNVPHLAEGPVGCAPPAKRPNDLGHSTFKRCMARRRGRPGRPMWSCRLRERIDTR